MIDYIEKTELKVKGFYRYKIVRKNCSSKKESHPDLIEYFNIIKSETDLEMKQINISRSKLNAIRGVHVAPYHKVAFCPSGKIFDVCVDMRPDSPTYKQWDGCWLDHDTYVFIPAYCAHGVFSGEEDSVLCYYQGGCFFPHLDFAINPLDTQIGIQWPKPINSDSYVLSDKDRNADGITPELEIKLNSIVEDPIKDRRENTNSDFVVCSTSEKDLIEFSKFLSEDLKVHMLVQSSLNRENLNARIFSLRPKYALIYFVNTKGKDGVEIFTEAMNAVHVCYGLGHKVSLIFDSSSFPNSDDLFSLIESEFKDMANYVIGRANISVINRYK